MVGYIYFPNANTAMNIYNITLQVFVVSKADFPCTLHIWLCAIFILNYTPVLKAFDIISFSSNE